MSEEQSTLRQSVGKTAARLQRQYLNSQHTADGALARGTLAELRKFASRPLDTNPLALQEVLLTLDPPLSEREVGRGDAPSPSERAAYYALSLFGIHMQSAKKPMHSNDVSFATACGQLYRVTESRSIKMRFDAMQVAGDEQSRLVHLRSLISLLRANEIACNYGQLAADLRSLSNPKYRDRVLLRWGRDFATGTLRLSARRDAEATAQEIQ
ncbi:CRISPR-associated protein [Corynebacterium renale]|uniref:type I-E CRISPR-associated protein Cse2/CasB n=1 Tax=Corynebacterium renale TaxID=1724 RepID=UPI000DA369A1|nr:type I-E CRISPR-associated protein Cse2/CasB [Corynebacterium renale]SQG63718.1 CRISPR-associated protein [Corynebacterium renale]STD01761.1 CRISPR-associated protein [Corynebacterium renale]